MIVHTYQSRAPKICANEYPFIENILYIIYDIKQRNQYNWWVSEIVEISCCFTFRFCRTWNRYIEEQNFKVISRGRYVGRNKWKRQEPNFCETNWKYFPSQVFDSKLDKSVFFPFFFLPRIRSLILVSKPSSYHSTTGMQDLTLSPPMLKSEKSHISFSCVPLVWPPNSLPSDNVRECDEIIYNEHANNNN